MIEKLLEQRDDTVPFGRDQPGQRLLAPKIVEDPAHALGVFEGAVEVIVAVFIANDEGAVAPLEQGREQNRPPDPLTRDPVLAQETRQVPVGIEEVALLVVAVEPAAPQAGQEIERLLARKEAGRQDGDLALEHLVEVADRSAAPLQ